MLELQKELHAINEKLANIDKTLAVQVSQLTYHIEQTNILRTKVARHEEQLLKFQGILLTVSGIIVILTLGIQVYANFIK